MNWKSCFLLFVAAVSLLCPGTTVARSKPSAGKDSRSSTPVRYVIDEGGGVLIISLNVPVSFAGTRAIEFTESGRLDRTDSMVDLTGYDLLETDLGRKLSKIRGIRSLYMSLYHITIVIEVSRPADWYFVRSKVLQILLNSLRVHGYKNIAQIEPGDDLVPCSKKAPRGFVEGDGNSSHEQLVWIECTTLPSQMLIHTNFNLLDSDRERVEIHFNEIYRGGDWSRDDLVHLGRIRGIEWVRVREKEIEFTKGDAFSWSDVGVCVIEVFRALFPKSRLVTEVPDSAN
jgi:hypothetical protein